MLKLTYVIVWKVLSFVYNLLQNKKQATQREGKEGRDKPEYLIYYLAYYCMVEDFPSQIQLNSAILGIKQRAHSRYYSFFPSQKCVLCSSAPGDR